MHLTKILGFVIIDIMSAVKFNKIYVPAKIKAQPCTTGISLIVTASTINCPNPGYTKTTSTTTTPTIR